MALSPEVEKFVTEMYEAAKANQDGGPNGWLVAPALDLVYKEREDPALRESDRDDLTTTKARRHRHKFSVEGTTTYSR